MICPLMASRVEELRDEIRVRVDARQIRALMEIAVDAGEGQIVEVIRAAVTSGNNMLDVQRSQW